MSDNASDASAVPGGQYETTAFNGPYETAVPQQEIIEKGGYSPRPQAYDLSNLPNAPTGPAQQSAAQQAAVQQPPPQPPPQASSNDSGSGNSQ